MERQKQRELQTDEFQNLMSIAKLISKAIEKEKPIERFSIASKIASENDVEIQFPEERIAMGSGGIGQIKFISRLNGIRIQLSYGIGRWNYAHIAFINFKKSYLQTA